MSWTNKRPETPPSVSTDINLSEAYSDLRQQALSTKRAEVGIALPERDAPAWGALMETGYRSVTVTLFALSDGTTSLYFSNGSGVIGGGDHEAVCSANKDFLNQANHSLQQLKRCETFPIPEKAETLFYVLTDSGILTGGALESDLASDGHPLSKLFHAGYEVITQLCVISDDNDADQVVEPETSD